MSDTAIPTTPITPAAPIAAPPAVQRSFNETLQKVAQQTSVPDTPAPVQEAVKIVPSAPPKPDAPASPDLPPGSVPPVAETVEAAPEAIATDTPPASDPETVAAPEMVGEIASEEDGLKLTAERNADGTFKTKLDPSQKFDFAVTDKESGETKSYSKTIPELMRMAKDGIWAQKVRSEVSYYRENVPKWEATISTIQEQLADQQALNRELLTAPDELVIQRREEYQREMSPEKRLERENAELRRKAEQFETKQQREQIAARSQSFLVTRGLAAMISDAEAKLGTEVVAGKLALATTPLMVNGVIPEKHWPLLEQHIKGPFTQWVTAQVTKQSEAARKASLAAKATEEAQRKAQSAVNDSTRTMLPVGRAAPDAPPELPKPKNVQEAISRMTNRPLPSSVGV